MRLEFGPAGIGGVKEAIMNLESFSRAGLKCAEIAFTYSIYIKKEEAVIIGKRAKELGISLSIHSPYYVNLNSKEREKREASKKRILNCCEIGYYLGARKIVFHCGYYTKSDESSKEETFQNIKKAVLEMQKIIKEKKWNSILCPEIMGKKNVFGSIEEVSRLVNETGCGFCIDFAHVLARYGKIEMKSIEENFPQKEWHCHFSGIIYGDKGEKRHRDTKKEEWKSLLKQLPKNKEISIICEAPNPFKDVVEIGHFKGVLINMGFGKSNKKGKRKKQEEGGLIYWNVKSERPEEYLQNPALYYTNEEVEKYARSSGMRNAQERIANRVIELLEREPGIRLLDVGCGPGYTAQVYLDNGYEVSGVDLMPNMVEKAKGRGIKAHIGDMRKLTSIFHNKKFDAIVSVSALQWIKRQEELAEVAKGMHSLLEEGGRIVIQFYPRSSEELMDVAKIFKKNGFSGKIVIDDEDNARKRICFIVMDRV